MDQSLFQLLNQVRRYVVRLVASRLKTPAAAIVADVVVGVGVVDPVAEGLMASVDRHVFDVLTARLNLLINN